MAVTTKDIAQICGVSRGTVDRALNNKPRINSKTKEFILNTAKELGYRPDFIARSLVKGTTMSIGVVVFDIRNRYFALLLNAIEKEAKKHNYSINITLQEKDLELEKKLLNDLVDRRVDGIILCPVNKGKKFISFIKELPVPVLTIGNFLSSDLPFLGMNERKAAKEGTNLIISKGYNKVVFVCPYLMDGEKENIYVHDQRLKGFIEAQKNIGSIAFEVIGTKDEYENICSYIDKEKKTAFFCSGDTLALELMKTLRENNIKIPIEVGLMGFDGLDILEYITPSLTTIYNPVEEIGQKAVVNLLDLLMDKEVPTKELVAHHIIHGKTL